MCHRAHRSSPFDVVKSRVMGQPLNPDGTGKLYGGMVDCFMKTSAAEGPMSLYNGFWPNFGRVVSGLPLGLAHRCHARPLVVVHDN